MKRLTFGIVIVLKLEVSLAALIKMDQAVQEWSGKAFEKVNRSQVKIPEIASQRTPNEIY